MLATSTPALPGGDGWFFEFKWDGVRALLDVDGRGARLTSRVGNDVGGGYPEVLGLAAGVEDALLDGEIVAFVDGRPSFGALQTRMHLRGRAEVARAAEETPVVFVVFDLLRAYGVDLTSRPYRERRETLLRFAAERSGWTVSPSFDDGAATLEVAREQGLEGVVAKRAGSPYRPGVRSDDWRKLRFVRAGDFVVLGWEAAAGRPDTPSSLLLGVVGDGGLQWAGKVGSGVSGRTATRLRSDLVQRRDPALGDAPRPPSGRVVHWTEPTLVVEVEFTAWTADGRLRQPVLRRIRPDKPASEAVGDA